MSVHTLGGEIVLKLLGNVLANSSSWSSCSLFLIQKVCEHLVHEYNRNQTNHDSGHVLKEIRTNGFCRIVRMMQFTVVGCQRCSDWSPWILCNKSRGWGIEKRVHETTLVPGLDNNGDKFSLGVERIGLSVLIYYSVNVGNFSFYVYWSSSVACTDSVVFLLQARVTDYALRFLASMLRVLIKGVDEKSILFCGKL